MGALGSRRFSNFIFAGLFGVALILFYRIILPFFMPVLLGAFLVVLFMPVHNWLRRLLRGRDSLCAGLSTALVAALILLPLLVVGYLVVREVFGILDSTAAALERVDLREELKAQLPSALRRLVRLDDQDVQKAALGILAGSAGLFTDLVSAGTELVIGMFLMLIAMYYFFLDGRRLVAECARLLPLDPRYSHAFIKEFKDVAYAIIYGNTLTAVLQGVTGFVGLVIARVPNAALWSSAMAVMAMIPIGGTALVWGPIGIVLIATHHVPQGLFVLGWGACFVSAFDNMIRPRLCGARMALHPLLVFLSMFGGIAVFGMMGLLVGPLIASLFMAMLRIYRRDFLRPPSQDTPAPSAPMAGPAHPADAAVDPDLVVTDPMVPAVVEPGVLPH